MFHIEMVKGAGCLCMLLLSMAMTLAGSEPDFFPGEVHGWALAPGAETYTAEDLYTYIDGASELYISYGFKKLITRHYLKKGESEITVDLFDMGGPGNAFGIFAHSQENPAGEIGQDSEYLDGLLRFWQGSIYVSLLSIPETPESQTALMALGRQIALRLPPAAERPRALVLLPPAGLLAPSIRFFHHPAWQNAYVFISAENILAIGPECEAILARYGQGEQQPVVLLVLYPQEAAAERAFANFGRAFNLPAGGGEAVKLADGKYLVAGRENRIVAAVWHGAGAEQALGLLSALREKMAAFDKQDAEGRTR
jgi:hypothetical protein